MTAVYDASAALYTARLAAISGGVVGRLAAMWQTLWRPGEPFGSLSTIGAAAVPVISGAQAAASREASAFASALAGPGAPVPGLAGTSARGAPLGEVTGWTSGVFARRLAAGWSDEDAARSAAGWLGGVGMSETYRAANDATLDIAGSGYSGVLSGRVGRITEPDACAWCELIADRGYLPSHAGFRAHRYCRCVAGVEVIGRVYSKAGMRRAFQALMAPAPEPAPPPLDTRRFRTATGALGGKEWTRAWARQADEAAQLALRGLPRVMQERFKGFEMANLAAYRSGNTYAYVQRYSGTITVRPELFGDTHTREVRASEQPDYRGRAWFSQDGTATGLQRTVAHEMGHVLYGELTWRQQEGIIAVADRELGRGVVGGQVQARELSRYSTKNDWEMTAEVWAEYVTNPNPRPFAKAVGDEMVRALTERSRTMSGIAA